MSDLFTFIFDEDNRLPFLTRDGAANFNLLADGEIYGKFKKNSTAYDGINVIEDFPWTKSPKSSRLDVPEIQLVEKRIINNSSLANFFYTILATADTAELATKRIQQGTVNVAGNDIDVYDGLGNILSDVTPDNAVGDVIQNTSQALLDSTTDFLKGNAKAAGEYTKKLRQTALKYIKSNAEPYVEQYEGLYFLEETGFRYSLPYLSDDYINSNVNFSSTEAFGQTFAEVGQTINDIIALDKPGTYVEQSKQVDLGEEGRNLTFKFPLLNTGTHEEIERNWQLIFALVYQNKHGRINRSLIEQPCIYEVFMEGISYMPYAYMNSIDVKFLGSRRKIIVGIPQVKTQAENQIAKPNQRRQIETTIPDAYEVSITLTGLNPESRNFMIRALGDPIIKVSERI